MGIGNIANTGMKAAMTEMEVISNNISNANTYGFKKSYVSFSDVYPASNGGSNLQAGLGVSISGIKQNFGGAGKDAVGGDFNLYLKDQSSFFILKDPNSGAITYTRAGQFSQNKDGYFVPSSGVQRLQGYLATGGVIDTSGGVSDIFIDTASAPATPSTTAPQKLNLDSRSSIPIGTFDNADSSTYNKVTSTQLYDSLGNTHNLQIYYIKSGSNAWNVEIEVDGTNIGSGTLAFTSTGQLSGTTGLSGLAFTPGGGAAGPQAFDIDMTGTTQFGSDMKEIPTKADGYAVGAYVNTVIDGNGVVTNIYDNQQRIDIGKVGLAKFEALDGLSSVGNMSWVETSASGSPSINASNSDGGIEVGSLELSNVDLTAEMISLISAQHNFQANAQVEQAYNEVMQTVLKI